MSAFERRMETFAATVEVNARRILAGTVERIHGSVTVGSLVTGAPGQPIAEGDLVQSWQHRVDGDEGHVTTRHPAARTIEAGTRRGRALVLRSGTGGFHSVALTIAGAGRLVEQAAQDGA